ncbi:hypothetical protein A8B78_04020 [Jannaschia sp. EhC01]|nr:hypothetical protein A8B78_04020 [Jannaschia sp. EhC01]
MRIALCQPDAPELAPLFASHAVHADGIYPDESNHQMDGAALRAEGTRLWVAWSGDLAVAMGGWKPFGTAAAELKSMHVLLRARGQGAAARIVEAVVEDARAAGCTALFLETGSREIHAPARRLYEKAAFTYCPPFGAYVDDPNSVFMVRAL